MIAKLPTSRTTIYPCMNIFNMNTLPLLHVQDERWDIGMTLADASRRVDGMLALSYHAIGYAMTGDMNKTIGVLQTASQDDGSKIAQEAVSRMESLFVSWFDSS